jgi:hypothetical protein
MTAETEYQLIKYALTFLLSNLDEDVIEDLTDYVENATFDSVEEALNEIINNY